MKNGAVCILLGVTIVLLCCVIFRDEEQRRDSERSSSSSSLAPKPPSRNSSFRAAKLSSSSAVFTEPLEKKQTSPGQQNSVSRGDIEYTPTRKASSAEDLDKPRPPKRYSQSALLNSFRSSKKPGYVPRTASTAHDQGENVVYHHARTQSLPSSKVVATHLSSKSWVRKERDVKSEERNEPLPRSSSFSRARVIETSSVQTVRSETRPSRGADAAGSSEVAVKTVQRDEAPTYANKTDVKYNRTETGVIQALKTGEVATESAESRMKTSSTQDEQRTTNNNKWNKQEYSKGEAFISDQYKPNKPDVYKWKPEIQVNSDIYKSKTEVQPKSILKPKPEAKKDKPKVPKPVPVLKENSLMQRLLQESQGQGGSTERSTAAAIEEEINQRTGKASVTIKSNFSFPKTGTSEQHQRLVR